MVDSESEILGDTWRLPNRVRAGSASNLGGIISGDRFPDNPTPWDRSGALNAARIPPYTIWEGDLEPGGRMVMLSPTIWEWDPGVGAWDGWLDWQVSVDQKYGQRAKEIFSGIWPIAKPVFDAVSLGIQTVGTLAGLWSPLGQSMRRPIGLQRDPNSADGFLFNPQTLALNSETADFLIGYNGQGLGNGVIELLYADDPYLRGVYSVFLQVEKLSGGGIRPGSLQSDWRPCSRCQGLFYGPGLASSSCSAGGNHAGPAGGGNFSLPHNVPADPRRQDQWRWCNNCQGLFWGPAFQSSACPAGGTHADPAVSGSGNYGLPHNVPADPSRQDQWRWCNKCQGLFYGPGIAASSCPAGGRHEDPAVSGSGNYGLPLA